MAASSTAIASAVSASVNPTSASAGSSSATPHKHLRQGELVLRCGQLAGGEVVEQAQRAAGVDQLVARGDPEPVEEAGQEGVEEHDPGVVDEEPPGFLVEDRRGRGPPPGFVVEAPAWRGRHRRRRFDVVAATGCVAFFGDTGPTPLEGRGERPVIALGDR